MHDAFVTQLHLLSILCALCIQRLWAYKDTQDGEGRWSGNGDKRQRGPHGPVMRKFHEKHI